MLFLVHYQRYLGHWLSVGLPWKIVLLIRILRRFDKHQGQNRRTDVIRIGPSWVSERPHSMDILKHLSFIVGLLLGSPSVAFPKSLCLRSPQHNIQFSFISKNLRRSFEISIFSSLSFPSIDESVTSKSQNYHKI